MQRRSRLRGFGSAAAVAREIQPLEARQLLAAAVVEPLSERLNQELVRTQPLETSPVRVQPAVFAMPESRGVVNVSVSRSGEISVSGDAASNFVVLDIFPRRLEVSSWQTGTQFRSTVRSSMSENLTVPLPAVLRSLGVNLRGGDDTLYVRFHSAVSFTRDMSISAGDGHDFVDVTVGNAAVWVGGDIVFDMAGGNDRGVVTALAGGSLAASRDFVARCGSGEDTLMMIDYGRFPSDSLEAPDRFRAIVDNSRARIAQPFRAGRDFVADAGGGNDGVTLLGVGVGRDLTIQGERGVDAVAVSNARLGRHLNVYNAEDHALQNISAVGNLVMIAGQTETRTFAEQLSVNRMDVQLGAAGDEFVLGDFVVVRDSGMVNGGGGENRMFMASPSSRIRLRNLVPGMESDEGLELLAGVLTRVPRPMWVIQCW
jgi:hypothetical protein